MTRWYLDSSAVVKLVNDEPGSDVLAALIDQDKPELVGSWLVATEVHRAIARDPAASFAAAADALDEIDLYEMPETVFREAALLPGPALRSLDALHLATAMRIKVDHVVTYDQRMAASARMLGLSVLAPA